MVGVLIVTHGRLAQELLETTKIIVGKSIEYVVPISVGWNDDMADIQKIISSAITRIDQGDGVLILTDMFGGHRRISVCLFCPIKLKSSPE